MFEGFREETMQFLWGVRLNNQRSWFLEHKAMYETFLYQPLKKLGADPVSAENILSERYDQFEEKTAIAKYARLYRGRYMIAAVEEEIYPSRPLMAQVADQLLTIRGVEASFVIAKTAKENDAVAVSSRSRGNVNVQTIMEKMKGGGHFTAAALQREHAQVADIEAELKQVLDAAEEEKSNEGNTAE